MLVVAVFFTPTLSTLAHSPHGQHCKTIRIARVNDTTRCFKNSNGTAGCEGKIKEWAKKGECRDASYHTFCVYSCTQTETREFKEFEVSPEETTFGHIACLRSLGLSAAGAVCVFSTVTGRIGAAISTYGSSELAIGAITTLVATACGTLAATKIVDWLGNPCCYSYCVKCDDGTSGGAIITTC